MKQIIFNVILIFAFCFVVFAQKERLPNAPIIDPNIYGKMSWKDEKLKLDDFAERLKEKEDKIGYITLRFDKKTTKKQKECG